MREALLLVALGALAALSLSPWPVSHAAQLPSYFGKPCSRVLPEVEFSKCCEDAANRGIPFITKGDRKLKIPPMNPMVIPRVSLAQGSSQIGLNLTWTPLILHGLPEAKISNAKLSWARKSTEFDILFPKFTMSGPYTAAGRFLLVPMTGSGPSNFTFTNLKVHYSFEWPYKKASDGKEYATLVNSKISISSADHLSVQMLGLFNGDRLLGNQMNTFLNDNWREVLRELGPSMIEAAREVLEGAIRNLISSVTGDELVGP